MARSLPKATTSWNVRDINTFRRTAVRLDWLEKAEKTADDRACPHGVQFYDVVVDGARHGRAAWCYEAPRPEMRQVGGRFGFWQDVKGRARRSA